MTTVETEKGAREPVRRFKFADAVLTDVGRKRNENQDAYGIAHSEGVSLYVVADGMGGARGGATASSIAVNVITKGAFTERGEISASSLKTAIERANRVIFNRSKGDEELSGMGTTVVALAFTGDSVLIAHVGDSRIYRARNGSIEQLTRDHTLVQELVDTGAIPEEEAANHPIAHMLTRSLGPTEAVDVEMHQVPDGLRAGDRFLLCSDGLYNLVSNEEIGEALRQNDLEEIARQLVGLALERGGTDNVTVEVLEACDVEDERVPVAYPESAQPEVTISQQVEVENLDEMIRAAIEEERGERESFSGTQNGRTDEVPFDSPDDPYAETQRLASVSGGELGDFELDESFSQEGQFIAPSGRRRRGPLSFAILVPVLLLGVGYLLFSGGDNSLVEDARPATISSSAMSTEQEPRAGQRSEQELVAAELAEWAKKREEAAYEDSPAQASLSSPRLQPLDKFPVPTERPSATIEPSEKQILAIIGDSIDGESGASLIPSPKDMALPPPPKVKIRNEALASIPADRPIIWENQAEKIARIKARAAETKPEAAPAKRQEAEPKVMQSGEAHEIIAEKWGIRERVGDLDAKLRLLSFEKEKSVRAAGEALKIESARVEKEIQETSASLENGHRLLERWSQLKEKAAGTAYYLLADEVAEYSEAVRQKKENYAEASVKYLEAVDEWQESPNDLASASRMGALGRDLQKQRAELGEEVAKALTVGIESTLAQLIANDLALRNLQFRREQLNRHIGYHLGFTALSAPRRKELRDSYLQERRSLEEELAKLQAKLSDEKEVEAIQAASLEQYRSILAD